MPMQILKSDRRQQDKLVSRYMREIREIAAAGLDRHTLGLLGMRERALLLGGEVAISGRPGQGTTVTVVLPLKTAATTQPVG